MEITLVRHGETEWNHTGRCQGITDIPLNDYGREIAQITKEGYEKEGLTFDYAYASPLCRAYETAQILVGDYLEVKKDERLKEFSFGDFEGKYMTDFFKNPEKYENEPIYAEAYNCFFHPEKYKANENGESYPQLFARAESFLEDLKRNHKEDDRILVVCHGGIIRALIRVIEKRDEVNFWRSSHKNLCNSKIVSEGEWFRVVDREHYYYDIENLDRSKHAAYLMKNEE